MKISATRISSARASAAQSLHSSPGFTLMEIVITILVISAVLYIISGSIAQSGRIYQWALDSEKVTSSTRNTLDLLFLEVKYLDSLTVADDNQLEFITQEGVQIRYDLQGAELLRSEDGSESATVTRFVDEDQSSFVYLNKDLDILSSTPLSEYSRSLVRFIEIQCTIVSSDLSLSSQRRILLENTRW